MDWISKYTANGRMITPRRHLLWNFAHRCINTAGYLNPINEPPHATLNQTSSISEPNRTFIAITADVSSADKPVIVAS